jgi:putative peptide zinc metalloprotease protein
MGVIVWMAHQWLSGRGLHQVADFLAFTIVAMTIVQSSRAVFQRPQAPAVSRIRPIAVALVILGLAALALFAPLPRSVTAPLMVQPSGAVPIYVATGGHVIRAVDYHSDVKEKDPIAELENDAALLRLQQSQTRRDEQQELVDALRKRQGSDPTAASQIPAAQDRLASIQERCDLLQRDVDQLSIKSPITGRLFPPPLRWNAETQDVNSVAWRETPLKRENRGAMLSAGTLVGTVGDSELREAVVMIDEADVPLVQLNQSVELLAAHRLSAPIEGKVTEISTSPIQEIPAEFYVSGLIPPELVPPNPSSPKHTYYQVRVELSQSARLLPIRSINSSRIRVKAASIFQRIAERYWR